MKIPPADVSQFPEFPVHSRLCPDHQCWGCQGGTRARLSGWGRGGTQEEAGLNSHSDCLTLVTGWRLHRFLGGEGVESDTREGRTSSSGFLRRRPVAVEHCHVSKMLLAWLLRSPDLAMEALAHRSLWSSVSTSSGASLGFCKTRRGRFVRRARARLPSSLPERPSS